MVRKPFVHMCHNSVVFTLLTGAAGTKQGVARKTHRQPVPPARDRKTPNENSGQKSDTDAYTPLTQPVLNYVPRLKADAHVPGNDLEKTLNAAARPRGGPWSR